VLSLRPRVYVPATRAHAGLLGPCYKTGGWRSAPGIPSGARGRNPGRRRGQARRAFPTPTPLMEAASGARGPRWYHGGMGGVDGRGCNARPRACHLPRPLLPHPPPTPGAQRRSAPAGSTGPTTRDGRRATSSQRVHAPGQGESTPGSARPPTLPPRQFQALLTLFSKCFASFVHTTCSLSVSGRYLALDGAYHPFCATLPSSTTL